MSAEKRQPWTKWYWGDWRANTRVRGCSLAARGLWADMLGLMDEGEPYGHLTSNGTAPSAAKLASLVGAPERDVAALLKELETAKVFSRNVDGIIYSRRMVRDRAKSEMGKAWGSTGGNPALTGRDKGQDNQSHKPKDKARDNGTDKARDNPKDILSRTRDPEARSQKEKTTDTEPTDSLPAAKQVVARFLELRAEHWPGHPNFPAPTLTLEAQATGWLQQGATVDLIGATLSRAMAAKVAKNEGPPTDFGCVSRSLPDAIAKAKAAAPPSAETFVLRDPETEKWLARGRAWLKDGKWFETLHGPPPDHPDTRMPADLRAELGIATTHQLAAREEKSA